nr:hypothetical protein [Tanacetum cinerariifolium]GEY25030.1 hypothetical protein [Tanacetum cinerariifolium]
CKLLAVGSLFFWQWEHPPLAVGTYTASGNSLLAVGMPCAFYSQQSSPKVDAPSALNLLPSASVERLFDEGGGADQEDFAAGGGQKAETEITTGVRIVVDENKLTGDHRASSEAAIGGKSSSALREFLASSMLNVEVGFAVVATLPMVISSVPATPEHESGVFADSIIGLNTRTIGASKRIVISLDSSHHSSTNAFGAKGNSIIRFAVVPLVMTEAVVTSYAVKIPSVLKMGIKVTSPVHASLFHDSDSMKTVKADTVFAAGPIEKMSAAKIDALKQRNMDLENEKDSFDGKKDGLVDQVHVLETTCSGLCDQVLGFEQLKEQIEEFQDAQMNIVSDKIANLDTDLLAMALHLEEKFYPTSSLLYLAGGRSLADVVACNPTMEVDYNFALWRLCEVDLSLLAELKSYKDASVEDIMNLLRLEDQVVLGETSLSFALSVTYSRVERIRENVAANRSALIGVWNPLVNPLSVENLMGEVDTYDRVTTTSLSTTFASASSVPPITIEDYEIVSTDGPEDAQGNGQGNVASFPIVEFGKEELDTTPEHDLPS